MSEQEEAALSDGNAKKGQAMRKAPSTNGRNRNGRFAVGNSGGPGNPFAGKCARLRSMMLTSVTEDDLQEVLNALLKKAKRGNLSAIRLLLEHCMGKASSVSENLAQERREASAERMLASLENYRKERGA